MGKSQGGKLVYCAVKLIHLLPTGSEEKEVLGDESFPGAILPSC